MNKIFWKKLFTSTFSQIVLLVIIMVLAFYLRLYKIDNPIADWHSWRQADTASVSRNFVKDGFNPLYPQFDALNALNETGQLNPNRYFFAEFPLYNIITYFAYISFGVNEVYARLISVLFATLTIPFFFLFVAAHSNKRVAYYSSFIFATLPYNIYYGRVVMPDPMYIFFSILTLFLVTYWLKKNSYLLLFLSSVSFSLAILEKPYALVLFLPILYLFYKKWDENMPLQWRVYLFAGLSLIPFWLWRQHIMAHPEGMFGTTWLFNQGNIRFTGAYFRWLIFDRMNRLIFATGGFVLFWFGLVESVKRKEGFLYLWWLLSILIFFVIIARGNVTHDYYQLPLVPVGCALLALGIDSLIGKFSRTFKFFFGTSVALALLVIMYAFGWYEIRGYYYVNRPEIVEAGRAVDKLLPKNAVVIAPYDNDSAFLYQTNRHGYTFGGDKIPEFIRQGATYLVSVNFDDSTNYWMKECEIIEKTEKYVIVNLQNCSPEAQTLPEKSI